MSAPLSHHELNLGGAEGGRDGNDAGGLGLGKDLVAEHDGREHELGAGVDGCLGALDGGDGAGAHVDVSAEFLLRGGDALCDVRGVAGHLDGVDLGANQLLDHRKDLLGLIAAKDDRHLGKNELAHACLQIARLGTVAGLRPWRTGTLSSLLIPA